ncbi:BTAD domain-containing putative transcriptional regulator [Kribbella sp. NPDC051770]|uniref:AfsR/SARP family transcriptional regulator n=1 Tax=Kribbella sp. NPDC051770 TaxID=3155413 RepID=UPI0034441FA8
MVQLELRFELLGPVRAWRGDTEIDLGAPQQRALLGLLLLRDGALATSDQLLTALWADQTPRAAAGMIRSYVSRLRRALSESTIQSVGGGYVLPVAPGALDLNEFLRLIDEARTARKDGRPEAWADGLRAALKLWKGTPLAGVRGDFAGWERERLRQHRLAAVEDLAAADLELGRPEEAAQVLAPIVIEHPMRERPRELLMLALYRSGRQADALRLYQETQHLLADELGVDPGPELREMHRRILASDPTLLGVVQAPVVVAPVLEAPEQLPPDLPEFTGRGEDLVRLSMLLRASGDHLPVLGLTGAPGIGKTSLAVHLGRRLASRFPAGQYYVHMSSAGDPLSSLLRAAGVATLPESPSERGALWRTLTAGRRVLVVLDNAKSAGDVLPLLPGTGGAAVVLTASRRLFGLPYADWVKVEPLSPEKSMELLERLVGVRRVQAEPADARRLLALSSGVPQAIQATASRLQSRPGWSLATAYERMRLRGALEPRHSECDPVDSAYDVAVGELSPEQAQAFRLLALLEGDFTLPAASVVLELAEPETEAVVESLVDAHLLESRGADRYYYLHPLQEFARMRAWRVEGEGTCQAVLSRVADYRAQQPVLASVSGSGLVSRPVGPGSRRSRSGTTGPA